MKLKPVYAPFTPSHQKTDRAYSPVPGTCTVLECYNAANKETLTKQLKESNLQEYILCTKDSTWS